MKTLRQQSQVGLGVVLALALQPLSVFLVVSYIKNTRTGEAQGWGVMAATLGYMFYFGMAQVLTILPASLLILPTRQYGVVRGLLYAGTFLALLNAAMLFWFYFFGR
jgi:NO-binding membrane sensor protein with MHYT domain